MDGNYDVIKLITNIFILSRSGVVNFSGIIKIAINLTKATFKDSRKATLNRNYVLKYKFYLFFQI